MVSISVERYKGFCQKRLCVPSTKHSTMQDRWTDGQLNRQTDNNGPASWMNMTDHIGEFAIHIDHKEKQLKQ